VSATIHEARASAPNAHACIQYTLWFPKEAQARAAFAEMPEDEWPVFDGMGGSDETEHGYISDWRCSKKADADKRYLQNLAARHGGEVRWDLTDAEEEDEYCYCERTE